jgi:hypothetical protein
VNAAFKAIDEVKRAQTLAHTNGGIRGGIPGSWPIGGEYVQFALPNWAAKFFIDALCAKRACLALWLDSTRRPAFNPSGSGMPIAPALLDAGEGRVVVYTTRISPKFASLAARWRSRGFAPSLVLIETGDASWARRWWSTLRRPDDSARICREHGWKHTYEPTVNSPDAIRAVEYVRPLIAVAAGAGILRRQILAVPRLGTLNAHMGLLPAYRGMNACEWSAFHGDSIGCSVLWVDDGIDTGPIIATRRVDVDACRSIADLRARVDECQLDLLDDTLRSIVERGIWPSSAPQRRDEGRQFFRMHADLRHVLEQALTTSFGSPRG